MFCSYVRVEWGDFLIAKYMSALGGCRYSREEWCMFAKLVLFIELKRINSPLRVHTDCWNKISLID